MVTEPGLREMALRGSANAHRVQNSTATVDAQHHSGHEERQADEADDLQRCIGLAGQRQEAEAGQREVGA